MGHPENQGQSAGAQGKKSAASNADSRGEKSSKPDANGEPNAGQEPAPSDLAQSADQFRQAAGAMRKAIHGSDPGRQAAQQQSSKSGPSGNSQPGDPGQPGMPGGEVAGGAGSQTELEIKNLEQELRKQSQRNWGQLPGQLKTEILQGASKKPRPEYARQIKSYFEEIAKPAVREPSP